MNISRPTNVVESIIFLTQVIDTYFGLNRCLKDVNSIEDLIRLAQERYDREFNVECQLVRLKDNTGYIIPKLSSNETLIMTQEELDKCYPYSKPPSIMCESFKLFKYNIDTKITYIFDPYSFIWKEYYKYK